jgi:hypothetical protein
MGSSYAVMITNSNISSVQSSRVNISFVDYSLKIKNSEVRARQRERERESEKRKRKGFTNIDAIFNTLFIQAEISDTNTVFCSHNYCCHGNNNMFPLYC